MLLAVSFLACMDGGVKWLVLRGVPVIEIIAIRGWVIVAVLLFAMALSQGRLTIVTKKTNQHIARSLVGFFAPLLFFLSLQYLSLADATAVFFSATFFMTAGSAWLLSEAVGYHRWLAVVIGFVGVIVVVKPGNGVLSLYALLPVFAAMAYALLMLWGRKLSRTESTFSLVFYFNLVFAVVASIAWPFFWHEIDIIEFVAILGVSFLSLSGYFLITKAVSVSPIGVIAPFEYFALVWALGLDAAIWHVWPELSSWIGIAIIVASGLYIMYREQRRSRQIAT